MRSTCLRRIWDRRLVCVWAEGNSETSNHDECGATGERSAGLHQPPRQLSNEHLAGTGPASRQKKAQAQARRPFWPPSIRRPHSPAVRLACTPLPHRVLLGRRSRLPFPAPLRVPRAAKGGSLRDPSSGLFGGARELWAGRWAVSRGNFALMQYSGGG